MPGRSHETKVKRLPGEYSVEDVALFNLTLFADYVWSTSSLDVHREACQKTWVKFNRIREAGQRTSVLDLLAEIRVDQRKTVRDTIPFSRLAKYGNYEYDERGNDGGLFSSDVTPLSFEELCLSGEGHSSIHWAHNSAFNSLAAENIVQNQLVREASEKMEGIDYAQQLEYTESFHKDPSLGRGQEEPIGNFGRLCGAFDPIKFNGLVKEILKVEPTTTTKIDESTKDACIPWINWLLCVYPEFLQSLCSRADFSHLITPDIEMSIDFLEILDKPVSAFDIHQFPKPKLRSWNRCRQGVRRLFQQITSQEVQRLWLCDDLLVDNRARLGLTASEEDVILRPLESSSTKVGRERVRRSERSTWIKKSPHVSSSHRKEARKNLHNNEGDKCKDKDKLDHHVVAGLKTAGTSRTPSAPTLTELNFEEFPTLSEAATMNFRLPAVAPGPSRLRPQGVQREKKNLPYDCHVEWGIFVGAPLQRNIHSKSDTDLHRSASQGSNSQSSPLSDNSLGLRSESDSDLQLQESFRRRESEAHGLLRSVTSGQSTSSEESCVSPSMQLTDDGRMNIHAPSFRPREPPSRPVITLTSSVSLVTNGQSKNSLRPDIRQPTGNTRHWTTQVQRPQIPAQQSLTDSSVYGPRRTALTFPQPPAHWRQPFPVLCKPPPGFETLCMIEGHSSLTNPSNQTPSAPPPQILTGPMVNAGQQFLQQSAPPPNQYSSGSVNTGGSVNSGGRPTVSFFPQAYSNQVDMFPYHNPFFADPNQRIGSTQSSPRQGPSTPTSVQSLSTTGPPTSVSQVSLPDQQCSLPESSNYVMSMPQFACPLGFPNQIFPRYLVPPPVRMPNPQQFLPSMPPPPPHQTQGTFGSSSAEVQFGWARFPQGPLPTNSPGFHVSPQSHFIHSYGFNQFPALPVSFPTSEGVQQQFHPLTWLPPQSRYKAFVQPITTSGTNFTQEAPLTSREETRDFSGSLTRGNTSWRSQRPSEVSATTSSLTTSLASGTVSFPIDAIGTTSSGSDDGRKPRPRKRDPSNLVHLVGADATHGRRERNRRPRCRLGRGILPVHDGSLLCEQRETPSEDSEQSATQNDESSEEWTLDPLAAESEDFSDVPEVVVTDHSLIDQLSGSKTRQRSLNTSESSRSSEPELVEEVTSPEKCPQGEGKLTSRYRSYKDCLQMAMSDVEGSQSRPDVDKLDSCRSSMGSLPVPRLALPMSMNQTGSSASFPSSPEKDGRPTSALDDTFCGQTTSPSSPTGCSPPQLLTPPRSYVATPTLLCSPPSCEPEALENALLQHLAKWSAAKMATEAEGMDSNETQNTFGFRWIPEDDLERQAAEEYCPSKENSHEKLAHGSVHSNLDRSASRGRATPTFTCPTKHESPGGIGDHPTQETTSPPPLVSAKRFPPKSIEEDSTQVPCSKNGSSNEGSAKIRSKKLTSRERSQSVGPMGDKCLVIIPPPIEVVNIGDHVDKLLLVEPSRGQKGKLCNNTLPTSGHSEWGGEGDHYHSVAPTPLTEKQATERTLKKLSLIAEGICPTLAPRGCKMSSGHFCGNSSKKYWSPKILATTNICLDSVRCSNSKPEMGDQCPEVTSGSESPRSGHQRVMEAFLSSATGLVKRLVFNAL